MAGDFHDGAAGHCAISFTMLQRQIAFVSIEIYSPFIFNFFQHETDFAAFRGLRRHFRRHVRQCEEIAVFQNNCIHHGLINFCDFWEQIIKKAIKKPVGLIQTTTF